MHTASVMRFGDMTAFLGDLDATLFTRFPGLSGQCGAARRRFACSPPRPVFTVPEAGAWDGLRSRRASFPPPLQDRLRAFLQELTALGTGGSLATCCPNILRCDGIQALVMVFS